MTPNSSAVCDFIKTLYPNEAFIALHEPRFWGNEKKYLNECIDSTFVSSVGKFVDRFERDFAAYVGSKYAVATVNGTAALHISLLLAGVERGDEVITQALSFVATANAISYCGAKPIFLDVSLQTYGLDSHAIKEFLEQNCEVRDGLCYNKQTNKVVRACVPMHTFGHPCEIDAIKELCDIWHVNLVEDGAESLGSYYKGRHTGTFGKLGAFSFNGNKIITSGGGGVIVTDDEELAKRAKHLTTTAKIPHSYEYVHDAVAYNYRLPNLNAALLCAQLEQLEVFLEAKRALACEYEDYFAACEDIRFLKEPPHAKSNYWLNAIAFKSKEARDAFLEYSNANGVMSRPIWRLLSELDIYGDCQNDSLQNSRLLADSVVNIPSSVPPR